MFERGNDNKTVGQYKAAKLARNLKQQHKYTY